MTPQMDGWIVELLETDGVWYTSWYTPDARLDDKGETVASPVTLEEALSALNKAMTQGREFEARGNLVLPRRIRNVYTEDTIMGDIL